MMLRNNFLQSELFKGISWTFASNLICNILRFLLVFVIIRCYSQEEFGLWASITSIAAIIVTGDLGLTNVLRNIATEGLINGEDGDRRTKSFFYSTLLFFLIIAILSSIALIVCKDVIPYDRIFKTDNTSLRDQSKTISNFVFLIFLFNTPLSIASALHYSFGEVKRIALIGLYNASLTFIAVTIMGICNVSITISAITYFLISLLVNIYITISFIIRRNWHIKYLFSLSEFICNIRYMLPLGIKFLSVGFASSFIANCLTIYSGSLLGLKDAANVNVAQKIFTFFCTLLQSVFNPIWAKLSALYYEGQLQSCQLLLYRSFWTTSLISFIAILITTSFSPFLMDLIATSEYEISFLMFAMVGICSCMKIIFDNATLLLLATSRLNFICGGYIFFLLVVIFVFPSIVSIHGFEQMMLSLSLCWFVFILFSLYYSNKLLRN